MPSTFQAFRNLTIITLSSLVVRTHLLTVTVKDDLKYMASALQKHIKQKLCDVSKMYRGVGSYKININHWIKHLQLKLKVSLDATNIFV